MEQRAKHDSVWGEEAQEWLRQLWPPHAMHSNTTNLELVHVGQSDAKVPVKVVVIVHVSLRDSCTDSKTATVNGSST